MNSDVHQLIHIVYHHPLQQQYMEEWLSHVKNILCINGFCKVWIDIEEWLSHVKNILCINGFCKVWIDHHGVNNQIPYLGAFQKRCQDIYTQQCLSKICDGNRCRMYKEIKLSFSAPSYIEFNICKHLRI